MTELIQLEIYLQSKINAKLNDGQIAQLFFSEYAPSYELYLEKVSKLSGSIPVHLFHDAHVRFSKMLLYMGFPEKVAHSFLGKPVKFSRSLGVSTPNAGVDVALGQVMRKALEMKASANTILSMLASIIGHEFGHVIDEELSLTPPNSECFAEYFGRSFVRFLRFNEKAVEAYWQKEVQLYKRINPGRIGSLEYKLCYLPECRRFPLVAQTLFSRFPLYTTNSPLLYSNPLPHKLIEQCVRFRLRKI